MGSDSKPYLIYQIYCKLSDLRVNDIFILVLSKDEIQYAGVLLDGINILIEKGRRQIVLAFRVWVGSAHSHNKALGPAKELGT